MTLIGLAQPLGAHTLTLSITVDGTLKDGGRMSFAADEVKPTHPTKPLTIAQTLFNALVEGATYEADLTLDFGTTGRSGLEGQLQEMADRASEEISTRATFDRPIGGNS
jgi:hypothetical protein